MKKEKMKDLDYVKVRFEELDDDCNVINVIAEKDFPDACFSFWRSTFGIEYGCFDSAVMDYVYKQHCINDTKYDYADWENAPHIIQAFYNGKGELMFTEDEVNYEMNL